MPVLRPILNAVEVESLVAYSARKEPIPFPVRCSSGKTTWRSASTGYFTVSWTRTGTPPW